MNAVVGPRWGNVVEIPGNVVSSKYDEVTVFDTGIDSILRTPATCTLTLDLDGIQATDDRVWARLEIGLGGYERKLEIDWLLGQQVNFACNRARVIARRLSGANSGKLKARASMALGSRSTSARPPTWTSPPALINNIGTTFVVPKHAKSFRIIADMTTAVAGNMTILQTGLVPGVGITLLAADIKDVLLGKYSIPIFTPTIKIATAVVGGFDICVAYDLDL